MTTQAHSASHARATSDGIDGDTPAVETIALTKAYPAPPAPDEKRRRGATAKEKVVLDALDLRVDRGQVVALLGPNGAGKTTTVALLSTLIRPTSGRARVFGHDVVEDAAAVRRTIGVTGQFSAVDGLLSGRENLRLMADLQRLDTATATRRVDELLEQFDLVDAADALPSTWSGGMRRRLDLAMTLVVPPRLLFLDEPTTGLDPRGRRAVWAAVRALVDQGTTVLLTTQYLEEADHLADRVVVLDHGRVVADDSPQRLKQLVPGGHVQVSLADGTQRRVPTDGSVAALRELLGGLDADGVDVADITLHQPDLDDVFLALTGQAPVADLVEGNPR
jgi:ABC-2 type transport system ATP-binding protein